MFFNSQCFVEFKVLLKVKNRINIKYEQEIKPQLQNLSLIPICEHGFKVVFYWDQPFQPQPVCVDTVDVFQ